MMAKVFEETINNMFKDMERNLKRKDHVNGTNIFNFLLSKILIRNMVCNRNNFWKI
jgi:hypothetical protein